MNNIFDIIIVGAGPAGLRAAKILAADGQKVLVLEKNDKIGAKLCAGGMAGNYEEVGVPENLIEHKIFNQTVYLGNKKFDLKFNHPIVTLSREKLGGWLAAEAQSAGAQILTNKKVTEISADFISCGQEKLYFKYLIGADGANSLVRQYLKRPIKVAGPALEFRIEGNFKEMVWYANPKKLGNGYAWLFPHPGFASVGIGALGSAGCVKNLISELDIFLNKIGLPPAPKLEGATINCDYRGYKFNNFYLAGEAAGLVNILGEGIYPALLSGEEIARIILDKNYKPVRLEKYIENKKRLEKTVLFFLKLRPLKLSALFLWLVLKLISNYKIREFLRKKII
jgi:flavin-dependent dehydrogenase